MGAEQMLPSDGQGGFRVVDDRRNREVYVYRVPLRAQADVGIESLGIVKLTLDEEERGRSGVRDATVGAMLSMKISLATASLQQINGKPVPPIGEGRDAAVAALSPKARELLLSAYAAQHAVDADVSRDFLAGVTVSTQ